MVNREGKMRPGGTQNERKSVYYDQEKIGVSGVASNCRER